MDLCPNDTSNMCANLDTLLVWDSLHIEEVHFLERFILINFICHG